MASYVLPEALAIAVNAGIEAAGKRLGHDVDMVLEGIRTDPQLDPPEIITVYEDVRHAGREMAKGSHRPHRRRRARIAPEHQSASLAAAGQITHRVRPTIRPDGDYTDCKGSA